MLQDLSQRRQNVEKRREGFGYATRLEDDDAGEPESRQGERHRHAVIAVGPDLGGPGVRRGERFDDETTSPPNGRVELDHGEAPERAGDESFSLRGGLRFLFVVAAAILLLSVLCWLVGGPQNQ